MRYFGKAKDQTEGYRDFEDDRMYGTNYGPGFSIDDAYTMEREREMFNEAMDSSTLWAQRVEFAGSLKALNSL